MPGNTTPSVQNGIQSWSRSMLTLKWKNDHLLKEVAVSTLLREDELTSFLSHTSMSYWWKNSILLSRRLSLCTFMTCANGSMCVCVCVFVFRSVLIVKANRMLHTFLMFFYCVIYSAEPCWGEFCRKAAARPWWPWWSCRQSFPVVEPRRRSATRLLCVQRGKAQSIVKLINVRRTQNFCLS